MNRLSICIVGPVPPPYGGMAVQTELLFSLLQQEGLQVHLLPVNVTFPKMLKIFEKVPGLRTFIRLILFCSRLLKIVSRVDLFHIFSNSYLSFFLVTMPVVIIGCIRSVKIIVNYRGGLAEEFLDRYDKFVRPILNRTNQIVVPTGYLNSIFRKFKYEPVEVPNILARELVYRNNINQDSNSEIKLVVTRRLEKLYNLPCAIRTYAEVKKKYPDVRLIILGEGSQKQALKHLVKELQLTNVLFKGQLPNENVFKVLLEATVLLNPTNADNMPISLLEAFAAGVPVVSTNVGGVPYLIEDGKTGFLVEKNDHQSMAKKVELLLENPDLYQFIVHNAQNLAKQYQWMTVKPRLFDVYQSVLRKN